MAANDKEVLVKADHVKVYFKGKKRGQTVKAVDDVSFEIMKGETFGVVGESGCGKSTLGRTLIRLQQPTDGHIYLNGTDIAGLKGAQLKEMRKEAQIIFQDPYASLDPRMTVSSIIEEGMVIHKMYDEKRRKERVYELLEMVGLNREHANRFPHEFSGGQRQRVAIGRAIVRNPQVLLMDEPLSNLDAKLRNQMRAEIIKLREKIDTTFIYVTHDQVEAMTLGDRIVIMRDGFIQQIGTPQEVFNHPANLFVAGFIGSPQMNFFENCQLTKTADSYTLTVMGETVTLTAEQSAKLAAAGVESRSVTAGVRPVHISLGESGIPAEVDVSELMGSELHLHLAANGQDVVAVIPTANIDPGAYARHTAVKFGFDAKLVHLFDSDSEKNLI